FAYQSGVLINQEHVYSRFRDRGEAMSVDDFEHELTRIKRFARYYDCLLRPQREQDREVRQQLERLNILESATGYPFLLFMYDEWHQDHVSREEFIASLRLIEAYMVRRFLNRDSTNYLNKMFPTLVKDVDVTHFAASLRQALGTRNEPSDVRLRQSAETVGLYRRDILTRQKLALVFNTINRHLSAGSGAYTVLSDDPTIEHIMPQTLTEAWRYHLGDNWQQDYELLDTLGNLTVVTQDWNAQLSNSIYETKRQKLAEHGLLLNQAYFGEMAPAVWNGQSIRSRAQWLMVKITEIWPQLCETAAGWDEKPKAVIILDEVFPVNSWRDVLRQTAEIAVQWCGDKFEEQVVDELPVYFSREPFSHASHQLNNGWWMYINLSADSIKQLCSNIIQAIDIPEDEYDVELW
ncbi:MAG: HNH endonuclease, partial [Chloroflexi bacterium]|nr:HNH endonuclease [Chloroflexota bacterium]